MDNKFFRIIKTEEQYERILSRIEKLMDLSPESDTDEGDELELLLLLVKNYEDEHYKIDLPDPIEAIKYTMEQQELTQRDLIPIIGSRVKVSEVLNKKRPLTLKMIRALNRVLGIPAEVLLHDENAKLPDNPDEINFEKDFPLTEMFKRGLFDQSCPNLGNIKEHAEELIRPIIEYVTSNQKTTFQYRQNIRKGSEIDGNSLIIWKYLIIKQIEKEKSIPEYDESKVNKDFMNSLIQLSYVSKGPIMAKEYLESFGIYMVIERHFKKTHLDGVSFFIKNHPVIALTLRHDRVDNFWFALFHELAHIKLHLNNIEEYEEFIDNLDIMDRNKKELEADGFALNNMISEKEWSKIFDQLNKNRLLLESIGAKLKVHPAIIAGRYRAEINNYKVFSKVVSGSKVRYLFE